MKGQSVVICPQCGENKVKSTATAFSGMIAMGIFCCVTLFGIPLGIILIIAAFVIKYSKARLKFRCQACKHDFKISKETYTEYKQAIG